jgi:hypothetical protein
MFLSADLPLEMGLLFLETRWLVFPTASRNRCIYRGNKKYHSSIEIDLEVINNVAHL